MTQDELVYALAWEREWAAARGLCVEQEWKMWDYQHGRTPTSDDEMEVIRLKGESIAIQSANRAAERAADAFRRNRN